MKKILGKIISFFKDVFGKNKNKVEAPKQEIKRLTYKKRTN